MYGFLWAICIAVVDNKRHIKQLFHFYDFLNAFLLYALMGDKGIGVCISYQGRKK